MSKLLPSTPDLSSRREPEPRVIAIEDDAADELFEALASETARTVFRALHDEPAAASRLAEAADTSVQNVRYHLEQLGEAGLVEVAGTQYSSKGREMDVYAPTDEPLVMLASGEGVESTLRGLLERLVGGVAVLAVLSVLVHALVVGDLAYLDFTGAGGTGGGPAGTPFATGAFAGSLVVLALALGWWYLTGSRSGLAAWIWDRPALSGRDLDTTADALVLAAVGAVVVALGWLAIATFDVVIQPVGGFGLAQLLPLVVIGGAAAHAYVNDGLVVSWAVVFLPLLALGLASIGLGLAGQGLAQLPGAIGYPVLLASVGALVLGTVGFVAGVGLRVVVSWLAPMDAPGEA
ncbi:MAG: helix-turn-helix domain-containing protein [Halobacteriales archaeon]|nr:helix-turn-helix domain-containing protein [Halobacteriales archaeon]